VPQKLSKNPRPTVCIPSERGGGVGQGQGQGTTGNTT